MVNRVAGVLRAERRRAQRHQVDLRFFYVWTGVIFEARTIDVSMTGVCLQTQVDLGVDSLLETRFAPVQDGPIQSIDAKVVWTRPVRTPEDHESFQCGLRFLDVQGDFERLLRQALPEGHEDDDGIPMADAEDVVELSQPTVVDFDAAMQLRDVVRAENARHDELLEQTHAALAQAKRQVEDGDVDGAISVLEAAVARLPVSSEALEALGEALYRKGDIVRAVSCFDKALRIKQETER